MTSSEPPAPGPPDDRPGDGFGPDEVSLILRRAIDLAGNPDTELGASLSAEDLASVAAEAGITGSALAAALSEARAGLTSQRGLADRLIGPAKVSATTALPSDEDTATANLRRWLEVEHGLAAYVRQDGVVVASRRGGVVAALGTGLRRIQGTGALNRARSVRAAAATVEDEGTVTIVADVSNRRTEAIVGGTAVTGGSVAAIGMVAVVAGPLALVAVPVAVVAGIGTARTAHRRTVGQVAEQVAFTAEAAVNEADATNPARKLLPSGLGRRSRSRRRAR